MSLFSDKLLEAGQQAQWNSPVYDTQGVAPHYDVEKDEDAGTISKLGHRLLGGLEGFGGDALKGIGTYLDYLDEKGRESSYIDSIRDSDGGYLKDAGDWFINNGQYLSNDATTMRQKYGSGDKYADKSLGELLTDPDYLFSSDGAIGDAMEGIGSTLPFIALNYLIPGSGLVSRGLKGASGLDRIIYGLAKTPEARKEAMKILATGEGRETLAGLARQQGLNAGDNAARRAAMWALDKGAGTAGDNALKWAYSAGPMDALTNAAGMYDDLKEQGYSYEDMVKAMGTSAKEELPLDMLNMALFGTVTKGTVGNLLKGTAKPKKIIGNLLGLPIEGLSEDYQEAMQQRLNNKYTGKEYGTWDNPTPDEAAAGAQGFIGSLLPGAFGTGMGIRHSFKGQDDRATRIGTAWDNIRSLNGEPPMTNSAMDMIAEANASTNAKLAAENAAAQKAAEQASQPAFAVAQDEQAQESASPSYFVPSQALYQMTDGVNHDGFDEGTEAKLRLLDQYYAEQTGGDHLLVTSMRDGSHSDPNHAAGRAFDVANDALHDDDLRGKVIAKAQELGLRAYDEYDHSNWTENTTGDNLHLSDTGEPINVSMSDAGGGLTLSSGDEQIDAWIQEAADANGVPANLLSALLDVESGYNVDTPNSEAGAIGIAQFMPGTAEAMGIDPRDPHQAISGAARLLKQEYDHYGNWSQALEAYNGGEGKVGSGETQAYAQKVLGKAGDISHVGGGPRSSASTNFLNEKPSFDINSDDAEGRKMISDFIDYWGNRANVDDADTIQGMLDANGKFRNTQENRDTVREKWGDELQQYADEHMTDEQQAGQETKVQKQAQQQADAARRAAQGGKKAASADNTKAAIDTSTPSLDAAKQQQVSTTPQATSIDTAGESEQTQAEPAQSLPNTAHLQPNTEHPASETAHPATAAQAKAQQAQPTTQASQPTAQAAPIEQGKAPTVPKNETQNAEQSTQTPAQPQGPTLDAQQATKQQNALPQPAQTSQQATAQMSPAQQRARAAKEQRLQKELETNATLDQIERGQQLEAAAKQAGVTLPQGMAGSLHRGQAPAIAQATELLQQKGVSLPTVEASGSTVYGKAESNNGWGSTERARFYRKLKKAHAGLKKQKPKSKDERELVNSIDKAYQDIQDALEGLKNGTMSAKDAGHLIWKRHGEVASKWQNTKNKGRYLGTRGAYENAFNDATTEVHYASVEAGEDNSRSTEEPTVDPVTSKQVMQGYRDAIDETVDDYYKGELTAEESRIEMERTLEKAQGEPESRAREEDQQAFDEYVTQKENEVAEDNRQKLDGHMRERNEAKSQAKEAVANGGRENSAQPPRKQLTTKASYTDKSQEHGRGSLNGDKITAWDGSKGGIPKKDLNFSVTLDEIEKALASYGNGRAGLRKLVKQRYDAAVERWIESAKNPEVRAKRRHYWEDDTIHMKGGAAYDRAVDSYARVVEHLYEAATGQKAESPFERHMRERSKEKQQEKAAPSNAGRDNSAQNPAAPRKVEPAENASGQQMEKPSSKKSTPSRKPVKGKAGKSVTVTTDSGKELHARYRIVPASSLTTSNVYDGDTIAKNDAYPQELQPRERSGRKEMQAQTDGMAADLHPADLEASRNLNQGAPLIRSDGVVLNGNGRTMAITRAYALRNKAGKRYTQYLIEHAEDFGFTKDQMRAAVKAKGTGKPVLVRELTDDADEATTQDIINSKTGGARMSATEQAETDAKSITSRDFDGYDAESDGDLTKAGNDGFVAKLLRKLVGKDEINAYTDANGSVNQDGYRRVKRAIFSRAYGDTDLIAKMAESMDDAIKNISNGLQSAAANVARLNLKMQEGNAYSYPLADTIARAVKKYNAIKEGKAEANVEAYASENETSLTGGDPEEVVKMVQALDDFHRSGKKVGTFLNHLADILDHQGSPKEDATAFDFGEASKPLTLSEAIDQAKEKTVTGGEQNLFGAPKYSIEEAKERHERTLADLKREIASAFPGAKNVREDSDHIAFTMPNGSHLEIWTTDNIELSPEEEAQAKRDHGVTGDMHIKVNGYEVTVGKDAIIALSKAGEKGTAYHEVLHIAMDILFSDREKAALAKKFGKGRGTVEEHIAEAFRRYKLAREHGAHVPFGKLFQRIQDFFANLADHYKALRGTMTDADVARRAFRELANGKAWERDAGEGRGARKFAGEANADENPVDNGNEQADNEGERKLRESLIEKVTDASFIRHISDRMTVEQIREQLLTQDLQHKDSLVRRFEDIERKAKIFHMTEEDAKKLTDSVRKVLKDALRIINAKRRLFNEPEVRGQLEHALRSADKIGSGSRLEKSLSDRRGRTSGLDAGRPDERLAAELVPGEHKRVSHPIEEEIQKELTEENHGQHYSISRSDNQDGFSRAQNPRKYSIAYHGTQHEFDQFDVGKIGSGEGSQVHGWGIYFAKDRKISEGYRDLLTPQKTVQIDGKPYRIGDTALQRTVVDADGNEAPANIRYAVKALLDEGSKEKAIAALRQKSAATKLKGLAKQTREAADILQHQDVNVHQEGMLAEVSVPEDDVMLDEQKSGEEQPKSVRKALHAIVEDIQKSIDKMHEVDKVLADKSKSLDERLGFEAEDRDALLSDEKTLLNRVAAARTESDDKALGIYNWITMFEPLEDGRSGKEIYEKLSQLFGGDDRASRILNEYGIKGIKYNGHRDGDCYVVFDDKAVSIIRKLSASRAKEAHTRAIEDIKAEVLKAFPGAKDVKDTEGRITFTMPNGAKVAIRIHDNMTVSGEEASRARRAHGIADGVTITVNGSEYTIGRQAVIDLSQRGEVGTVYHEALHVAMDLLFDDKTKAALMKKYGSEEKIADAYRKFMLAEARGGHVPFGKPLRAIRDFFRALAAHIAPIRKACGDAWTAQKAFEDLASGKAWEPASKKSHGFSLFSHAEAAERPIDNEAARGDNEGKEIPLTNNIKVNKDGSISVALKYPPKKGETPTERIKRRKKEVRDIDASLVNAGKRSAYVNILSQRSRDIIDARVRKGEDRHDIIKEYLLKYNKILANYSEGMPEGNVIGLLVNLKGAMYYAGTYSNDLARGNGRDAGAPSGRNADSGRMDEGAQQSVEEGTVTHEKKNSVSRSETQDGFSDARKSDEEYLAAVDRYENAKTDEERAHALDDLRTMVQEAADAAGFHDAVPEQTVAYHTREGAAPKKTIKVYKVFTVSPDGSPTALFIGGTEKLPQGVWLDAQSAYHFQAANGKYYVPSTQNPYTKGGKTGVSVEIPNEQVRQELIERGFLKPGSTAKKITALAYRPGWHAGTLPFFPQGGKKDASANYGMVHRENQVVFECELAADKNYTQEARAQEKAKTKTGKLNLKNADLQYMPENGFYFYATNPLTQSHPELGAWAISGSLKINRALSQEECDRILEKNGMKPQAWEQGKMNLQDLGYTGEQNDAARKTLAPITYDDSGNVIPLSERFNPEKHDIRYSISEEESKERAKGWLHSVGDKLAKGLHLKGEKIMLEEDAKDPSRDINLKQYIAASPSRVAEKVKTFRVLYVMADRAMNKVVSLRDGFERKLNKALALASSKDDRQDLFDLLLRGDAEGKEWTRQELIDDGVKENVADAYIQIRRQLNRAYHLVNDARRKPTPKSETVDKDRLAFLKANKFVTDLSVTDKGDGKYLVSYKEYKNYPKTYKEISADMVERFKNDTGIQVVDVKEAKTESGHAITDADGKPLYNVTTTEGPAELHKLKGYIPHFFHEYFLRVVDKDGNARTIGSARNQREAVMQAEAWMKDHKLADGETIHVQPKVFDINKALGVSNDDFAPVMGDKDFLRVQKNLAKQNDMTLAEAKDMLDGAVRLKGRHRFFGNALHRTGAAGFETDLDWALRHYFNSASRYVAMETEFKPKAISYFERVFGAFDKDYNNNLLAKYCKDYINDINGTPSSLEQAISKALNSTWLFKKVVIPTFGDRAALTLGNGIANKISYMTLGLNMSSALLNFSQLMNSAAYIGDVRSLGQMMRKGMHRGYSLHELRILKETGVLNDIGIDSGSGYDKLRGGGTPSLGTGKIARALTGVNRGVDFLGQKSMYFFQQADSICRRGTVLVAYEKARKEGKSHAEAIAYAKDVNNKANFQYGTQDAPNIFRRGSIVSQLALQFKKYGFKELEVMADFSPWSKKTSRKQKLMFWGMYALLCGAMGVPALDWLDEIFGEKTGFYTKDELQKAIIHLCGGNKRLAVSLMYGIPAAFNINLSSRAGMSDVIPTSLGDFAGPTISKSVRLAQDLLGGDYANALRDVNPGLYNLYAAGTGESRGKRDRLNDRYVTAWDRILRAVGFRSVDETIPTDMQRIISRDKAAATKERQEAQDAYIQNPTSENKQRLKDLGIKEKDVQKEATKKNQTREERTQGTVPKKDKDKYKPLTDFMKE